MESGIDIMNNLQMLKRKYIMRNWIDQNVPTDRAAWYRRLLSERTPLNSSRLP